MLAGRRIEERDNSVSPPVAVVNETFARKIFGGLDAVGRSFSMAPTSEKQQLYQVIGVVRDVKTNDIRDPAENGAWLALAQNPVYSDTIAVRVSGDPRRRLRRGCVRRSGSIEPNLPIRIHHHAGRRGERFAGERTSGRWRNCAHSSQVWRCCFRRSGCMARSRLRWRGAPARSEFGWLWARRERACWGWCCGMR